MDTSYIPSLIFIAPLAVVVALSVAYWLKCATAPLVRFLKEFKGDNKPLLITL